MGGITVLSTGAVRTLAVTSLLAGALLLSQSLILLAEENSRAGQKPEATPASPAGEMTLPRTLPDFIELAEHLSAAVVNISIYSSSSSAPVSGPRAFPGPGSHQDDPFRDFWEPFEHFFSPFPSHSFQQKSLGSGVILDQQGYILTNNHVIENAEEILVTLTNEKEYHGTLVGTDPKTDLALIKINGAESLTTIALGDSDNLRVGEWVLAIGNPFGLDHTVTAGIVSAKGRNIGHGSYDQFIQTDASINPGNSGGPLINLKGEVVGINTAIYSRTGGNVGIGFAIPVNVAKELVPQLKTTGKVTRGWIGVMIQKVTPEIATSLELPAAKGARIAEVIRGGPAQEAGLKAGDVIVSFNGRVLGDSGELPLLVARIPIGETVSAEIVRENKEHQTVTLRIAELREEQPILAAIQGPEQFGLAVQELSPPLRHDLGLNEDLAGVLVAQVEQGSVAEEAGVQRRDVILEVNRQKVHDLSSYRVALQKTEKGKGTLLLVRRGEHTFFLTLKAAG